MEWVETTAKSVDAAKELALDQLHVEESDAEFEILEEPRPGLFGRMRGEARVRARVRPVQPRPKVDRRERRRGSRRPGGGSGGGSRRRDTASTADDSPPDTDSADQDDSPPDADAEDRERPSRSNEPRRGSRNKGGERRSRPSAKATSDRSQNEESAVSDTVSVEKQAEIVQEFLEGLVEAFGYEATVGIDEIDDETSEVQVNGEDLGLLVGPRGATLQAIHDLSRTVVQRAEPGTHEGRVRIDVAGYRQRRREALERFTQKLAEEALSSGVAQVLEPMSAADRKVVHDTANEIDGVHTTSEGEDARRHVVIVPDAD